MKLIRRIFCGPIPNNILCNNPNISRLLSKYIEQKNIFRKMGKRNLLILERSSQNLQKYDDKGKTVLEGVFAEFGVENRNGRVYEEKEYLPHLEYLKKDIANGNLLGELDHPERFEVALGNVSHRVTDLWYDGDKRQVKGRVEILPTPKGQIAENLLKAGVPLSISSRAAGTVNEDKRVSIDQIYTFDLVAKPGFEAAQLETVNESEKSKIQNMISKLNESYCTIRDDQSNVSKEFGVNENISILDLTDKYPVLKLREEAKALQKESKDSNVKNKNERNQMEKQNLSEHALQEWTQRFNKQLQGLKLKLNELSEGSAPGQSNEIRAIKRYVEKLRKVQEDSLAWQSEIAKAVNEIASYANTLAMKSNKHYSLTKKIVDTVDENAKVLNYTQDWVADNAKVTNVIAETVDHNAEMLNGVNEWNEEIAQGVNALHEWGSEKAKAINGLHEWTSSIAKHVNIASNWTEEMLGDAMSKEDGKRLVEYVELVSESKKDPTLKKKLDEALKNKSLKNSKKLNESMITGIKGVRGLGVITGVNSTGNSKVDTNTSKPGGVGPDAHGVIRAKNDKSRRVGSGKRPKGVKTLDVMKSKGFGSSSNKVKGIMVLDTTQVGAKPVLKITGDGPTAKMKKDQKMKLDTKPQKNLNEFNRVSKLKDRSEKLFNRLDAIIQTVEKEKRVDESVKHDFPFTALLSESDRKAFSKLSLTDKKKVSEEVRKNPTSDADVIKALWENVLATEAKKKASKEPLWLAAAPKQYRELYDKSPDTLKESIKARAEFYPLNTQYQIENFWQTSGLNPNKEVTTINEVFTAKTPQKAEAKMDSYVAMVAEQMKKYKR